MKKEKNYIDKAKEIFIIIRKCKINGRKYRKNK